MKILPTEFDGESIRGVYDDQTPRDLVVFGD